MSVQDTLAERAKTYGGFQDIARISGNLQRIMRAARNWDALPDDMREALQAIASKIARVLNGDCEHIDSWHDIAGYATLVADRLRKADAKVPLTCDPPLATPPDGYEAEYNAKEGGAATPWRVRHRSPRAMWHYAPTYDEALSLAQKHGHG